MREPPHGPDAEGSISPTHRGALMNETTPRSLAGRGRTARRALTVAGAAAAALALWALAGPVAGVDLTAGSGGTARTVGAGAVIVSALVAGLAAWALLASLERFLRAP